MTPSDKAVRKASRERLLRDFAWAARMVDERGIRSNVLLLAEYAPSRTRYACLMTAFGL